MTPIKTNFNFSNIPLSARSYLQGSGDFKKVRGFVHPKKDAVYIELSARQYADKHETLDYIGSWNHDEKGMAFDMSYDSAVVFANAILAAVKEGRGFIDRRQGEDRRKG